MGQYKASIDIGSNTILLLVAEYTSGKFLFQKNFSRITGLGRGIDKTHKFSEEAMEDSLVAFSEYFKLVKQFNISPEDVIVTATEASRVVNNAQEFFNEIHHRFSFTVRIISAEKEARLAALGVVSGLSSSSGSDILIMDIGGASTELIKVDLNPFKIRDMISLPMGSVRGTDWKKEDMFEQNIDKCLKNNDLTPFCADHLVCIAGSMVSVGAMVRGITKFDETKIHGKVFSLDDLLKLVNKIKQYNVDQLISNFPFLGKRASTILAGAEIGLEIAKILNVESFEISTYGLRHGSLVEGV